MKSEPSSIPRETAPVVLSKSLYFRDKTVSQRHGAAMLFGGRADGSCSPAQRRPRMNNLRAPPPPQSKRPPPPPPLPLSCSLSLRFPCIRPSAEMQRIQGAGMCYEAWSDPGAKLLAGDNPAIGCDHNAKVIDHKAAYRLLLLPPRLPPAYMA